MSEPWSSEAGDPPGKKPRHRGGRKVAVRVIVAVLGVCWFVLATSEHIPSTCALCRTNRVKHFYLGLGWSEEQETECSRWYAKHIEPAHAHCWAKRGYCQSFGVPPLYYGVGCMMGEPITMLSPSLQIEIYRHFGNPLEAKRLFMSLMRRNASSGQTLDSLFGWVRAGYPGTWPEWREKDMATVREE